MISGETKKQMQIIYALQEKYICINIYKQYLLSKADGKEMQVKYFNSL